MPLLTIYKSFIRPHLDYGDVIYDQAYTASFHQKIESVQYNSALAITGTIRGTSKEKLYHELGLETLEKRRWYRKLCCFFKIFRNQSPEYLFNIVLTSVRPYNTRNANNIPQFKVKQFFPKFIFPFYSYRMEQAGPKYTQLRKFIYLQEKAFEIYTSFWKQCFQMSQSQRNQITNQTKTWSKSPSRA